MTDEEKEEQEEQETEGTGERDKPESTPLIDRASTERKKLEEANKKHEELLDRQETIMSKQMLGGKADAGAESKTTEETPKEYAERVMKG